MKPEVKKLILLNLPYLLFVYLFGKVGQAFRLAYGIDLSAKLLHIGQGFTVAFSSAAPSFHPVDLLIGIAGAVIIRLVVYSKQKNAKKYRKGMCSITWAFLLPLSCILCISVMQSGSVLNRRFQSATLLRDRKKNCRRPLIRLCSRW